MAEARAASFKTRSIKASSKVAGIRLALSMLDLTTLEGKDSPEKVRSLCAKASRPGHDAEGRALPSAAAVCVYPTLIGAAKEALRALDAEHVNVAAVATGFPSGQFPLSVRLRDCEAAVRAGADEIDMVISRGAFLSGRYGEVANEIRAFKAICAAASVRGTEADKSGGSVGRTGRAATARAVHLKVILETGELETLDNVRRASDLAIEALLADGADGPAGTGFIKTSTGKVQPAATMPVTLVMLEAIRDAFLSSGRMIGMKPAGGIRTSKEALHYLVMVKETLGDAWLSPDWFRFGASALATDLVRQFHKQSTGGYAARYDVAME